MSNISKEEFELLDQHGLVVGIEYDSVTERDYYLIDKLDQPIQYYRSIREAYDSYFSNWPKKEDMDLYRDVTKLFSDTRKKRLA